MGNIFLEKLTTFLKDTWDLYKANWKILSFAVAATISMKYFVFMENNSDIRPDSLVFIILFALLFYGFVYLIMVTNKDINKVLRPDQEQSYRSVYGRGIYFTFGIVLWLATIYILIALWTLLLDQQNATELEILWLKLKDTDVIVFNRTTASISLSVLGFMAYIFFEFMAKTRHQELTTRHFFNASMILLVIILLEAIFGLVSALANESSSEKCMPSDESSNKGGTPSNMYELKGAIEYISFFLPPIILGLSPRLGYTLFDRFNQDKYRPSDMYLADILGKDSRRLEMILRGYNINSEREILDVSDYNLFKWFLYSHVREADAIRIRGWLNALIIKSLTGRYFSYFYYEKGVRCVECLECLLNEGQSECKLKPHEDASASSNGQGASNSNLQKCERCESKTIDKSIITYVRMERSPPYEGYKNKIKGFSDKYLKCE